MSQTATESHYLIIRSGAAVWTKCDTWAVDGVPYLMRGGLDAAKYERERAEAYRKEEHPELTEPAKIVSVTLIEGK